MPYENNVRDYGAAGDGVTNDTVAFTNAVAALPASGGTLVIPPGVYRLFGPIDLSAKQEVLVKGSGPSSVVQAGANGFPLFTVTTNGVTNLTGYEWQDLKLNGQGFVASDGIALAGLSGTSRVSSIRVSRVSFDVLGSGLTMAYCANIFVTDCFAQGCTTGYWAQNCADTNFTSCMAQNGSGVGFKMEGSGLGSAFDEGVRMVGCSTNGQGQGLTASGVDWGCVSGCSFTTCPAGDAVVLSSSTNWKFSACEFATNLTGAGLNMGGSTESNIVTGCLFALNTFGIVLKGSKLTVVGNQFKAGNNVDIQLDSATHSVVCDNQCDSTGVSISINEVNSSNFNQIRDNITNGTVHVIGGSSSEAGTLFY